MPTGILFFCCSIALEKNGELIIGVVYDPMLEELFYAEKGKGAYLNKSKISSSSVSELADSLVATGFPYDIRENSDWNINHLKNFIINSQAVRRDGSAALDLCYVAMGRFDGYWESKLNPWDMAAGALIIEEAGGKLSLYNGNRFNLYSKEIIASNGRIHREMVEMLHAV
ncbi:MAG: inositol monophosphatase family protein [bacterium]